MTDANAEAAEFEHRLPAAYSQGFAHVRVVSVINPYHTGPLGAERDSLAAEDGAAPGTENSVADVTASRVLD